MQILIVMFSLTAAGSLYGMIRYGGWNFSIHSANVVFLYIFLLSMVTVIWSWIALKEMKNEESQGETADTSVAPDILMVKSVFRERRPSKKKEKRVK